MHGGLRRKIDDVCLQSKQPLWWVLRDEMRQAQREIFDEEFDRVDAGKYVKELADRSVWGFGPCFVGDGLGAGGDDGLQETARRGRKEALQGSFPTRTGVGLRTQRTARTAGSNRSTPKGPVAALQELHSTSMSPMPKHQTASSRALVAVTVM